MPVFTSTQIRGDDRCSLEPASFQGDVGTLEVGLQCGGEGGRETETRDIIEELKDPCFKQVLVELRKEGLTNKITDALEKIFNSSNKVNIIFAEDPTLGYGVYGDAVITIDKRRDGGPLDIQITLNSSFLSGASKEIIAETMIHEILHAYIDATTNLRDQVSQHKAMAERYIEWSFNAMNELFSNMSHKDIYGIILNGFGQLHKSEPLYVNELISRYNLTASEIGSIADAYRTNEVGTKCN